MAMLVVDPSTLRSFRAPTTSNSPAGREYIYSRGSAFGADEIANCIIQSLHWTVMTPHIDQFISYQIYLFISNKQVSRQLRWSNREITEPHNINRQQETVIETDYISFRNCIFKSMETYDRQWWKQRKQYVFHLLCYTPIFAWMVNLCCYILAWSHRSLNETVSSKVQYCNGYIVLSIKFNIIRSSLYL